MQRNPEPFLPLLGMVGRLAGGLFRGRRKRDFEDEELNARFDSADDMDLIARLDADEL
jgi:hypothetical protein